MSERMKRDRRHLQSLFDRPAIERFDIAQDVLEFQLAGCDLAVGQSIKHECVVRIRTVSYVYLQSRLLNDFLGKERSEPVERCKQLIKSRVVDILRAVTLCQLGLLMDFDQQPIGSGRECRSGKRQNEAALA